MNTKRIKASFCFSSRQRHSCVTLDTYQHQRTLCLHLPIHPIRPASCQWPIFPQRSTVGALNIYANKIIKSPKVLKLPELNVNCKFELQVWVCLTFEMEEMCCSSQMGDWPFHLSQIAEDDITEPWCFCEIALRSINLQGACWLITFLLTISPLLTLLRLHRPVVSLQKNMTLWLYPTPLKRTKISSLPSVERTVEMTHGCRRLNIHAHLKPLAQQRHWFALTIGVCLMDVGGDKCTDGRGAYLPQAAL